MKYVLVNLTNFSSGEATRSDILLDFLAGDNTLTSLPIEEVSLEALKWAARGATSELRLGVEGYSSLALCEGKDILILVEGFSQNKNYFFSRVLSTRLGENVEICSGEELERKYGWEIFQLCFKKQLEALSCWGVPDEEEWGADKVPHNKGEIERHPAFWWPFPLTDHQRGTLWWSMTKKR